MSIQCRVFIRPYGSRRDIELKNINLEDELFFKEKGALLSMESDGNDGHILYADIGRKDADGLPADIIYIAKTGETCNEAMHQLKLLTEKAYG